MDEHTNTDNGGKEGDRVASGTCRCGGKIADTGISGLEISAPATSDSRDAGNVGKADTQDISKVITGSLFADLRALWRRGPELKKMTLMELIDDYHKVRLEVEKKYDLPDKL